MTIPSVYIIIFMFVAICILLGIYLWHMFRYWQRQGVEVIEIPNFLLGHFWYFLKAEVSITLHYYDFYKKTKGPFAGLYFANHRALFVKDPELMKQILVKDFNYFTDRGINCNEEKEPLSAHLFRLHGKSWRDMRTKLSPAFTVAKIKGMIDTINTVGQVCEGSLKDNSKVDISELCLKFTCDCFAPIVFGVEVNSFENDNNAIWKALETITDDVPYKRYLVFMLSQFAPKILYFLGMQSIYNKSNLEVFEVVKDVVHQREKNNIVRNDYMQLLIQLKNPNNGTENNVNGVTDKSNNTLSIEKLSASVYTMFYAGVDTVSTTITYGLHLLAFHPNIQKRVHEDIDRSLEKYGGQITYDSIADMTYLEMVLNETLRIYPALGFLSRRVTQDYTIPNSNVHLKKGTSILMSVTGLHNDPAYYPNPHKFDPERFSLENRGNIIPYTYLPFGDGPRNCIGKKFALMLCAIGFVWILKKFKVEPCEETINAKDIKFRPYYFSHVPVDHITVRFLQRKQIE